MQSSQSVPIFDAILSDLSGLCVNKNMFSKPSIEGEAVLKR